MEILALVPEAACVRACLDAAVAAARSQHNARVIALHIRVEPLKLLASDEEVAIQRLREAREGTAAKRANETRDHFHEWMRSTPPELARRVAYEETEGSEEEEVIRASQTAEILVMARPSNLDGHDAFHAAVFLARKPLLFVPPDWRSDSNTILERHVLVAWKESNQAVQAVEAAMPWLRKANKVTVLTVRKEGQPGDATKLLDALSREAVNAEWISAEPIDRRTSARILAVAEEIGASLIVMGAFRYGSFIEWALGATTQRAISQTKTPLLLAH